MVGATVAGGRVVPTLEVVGVRPEAVEPVVDSGDSSSSLVPVVSSSALSVVSLSVVVSVEVGARVVDDAATDVEVEAGTLDVPRTSTTDGLEVSDDKRLSTPTPARLMAPRMPSVIAAVRHLLRSRIPSNILTTV